MLVGPHSSSYSSFTASGSLLITGTMLAVRELAQLIPLPIGLSLRPSTRVV